MKYSSKNQEKFYKPYRIQVLIKTEQGVYHHKIYTDYMVVIRDTSKQGTKSIIDIWLLHIIRGGTSSWESNKEPDGRYMRLFSAKGDAIEVAKAQAIKMELPFNLQTDILDYYDVIQGERRDCMLCGKDTEERSFEPMVCRDCQTDAVSGRRFREQGGNAVAVQFDDITRLQRHYADEDTKTLRDAVELLSGAKSNGAYYSGIRDENQVTATIPPRKETLYPEPFHSGWSVIYLADEQVTGLRILADVFQQVKDEYYNRGKLDGQNFLIKMVDGELTADDVADKMARKDGVR